MSEKYLTLRESLPGWRVVVYTLVAALGALTGFTAGYVI